MTTSGSPIPSSTSSGDVPSRPRGRVLLVDDEAMVARVLGRLLERAGYEVRIHTSPAEALLRLQGDPQAFDVVVTDMSMPGMSGIDLARRLGASGCRLPVVLLSGWIDAEAEREARAAGIARVLSKPIQMATLVQAVSEVVPGTRH